MNSIKNRLVQLPVFLLKFFQSRLLRKRFSMLHVQLMIISFFTAGMIVGVYHLTNELVIPKLSAATSPWLQDDWSGDENQTPVSGNTTDYSEALNVTTTAEQITLEETSGWSTNYADWAYRKKITFDNTDDTLGVSSEDLTNFPILVKLDSGEEINYSKTQDNGEDLRFEDHDGTELSYEIEKWDESGSSYVWVKVPQIDQNSSTDYIYMYYGNDSASDEQNASDVWSNNYAGVWHLKDNPAGNDPQMQDSTGNNIDGTTTGNMAADQLVTGKIGDALDFDGSNTIELGSSSTLKPDDITIEAWVQVQDNPFDYYNGVISSMRSWGSGFSMHMHPSRGGLMISGAYLNSSEAPETGTWYHVVGTHNGTSNQNYYYMDGDEKNDSVRAVSYVENAVTTIGLFYTSGSLKFDGLIDEVRISSVDRSAAWIAASHISETDSLNTFADEEYKFTNTSGTLTSSIFNGGTPMDWGDVAYHVSGTGTVTLRARSDSNEDMSEAESWSATCNIPVTCTDGVCSSVDDLSDSTACVNDQDQFFQYRFVFQPDGASAQAVTQIQVVFSPSDMVAPVTNATSVSLTNASDAQWINFEPEINWAEGADNDQGSGVIGYCVTLDEVNEGQASAELDPATDEDGLLSEIDDGVENPANCHFIATGESLNLSGLSGLSLTTGKQYYVSIKAVDQAGNVYAGEQADYQDLISFKYDDEPPTNPSYVSVPGDFISTKSTTLLWPTSGSDQAQDDDSLVAGFQYRIGSDGTWYGDSHTGDEDINDLLTNDGSYTTVEEFDYDAMDEGSNIIYFRTWDNAGNISSTVLQSALKINTTAPSAPRELAVNPEDATTNSYEFSWTAPTTFTGQADNIQYCYTVNTTPNAVTCNWTTAGETSLAADAYATQPGTNTLYLVAKDEAGNVNYSVYTAVEFSYSGTAPGIPQNIDIADVSVKATSSWKLALSWEEPADTGAGISTYKIYESTDGASYEEKSTVTDISYVDTNLTQETHYYKVKACDSANNCGAFTEAVSLYPDGKYTTAADLTSDPAVTGITTKKATISWSTDRTADSKIQYGDDSEDYFDEEPSKSTHTTDHSIQLTNLSPGTTYYYKAKWTDEDGNTGMSDESSFTTDPAPSSQEVSAATIGLDYATIQFTSSNATSAKIYYGETTAFGGFKEISTSTSETTYSVNLTGLDDGTKYYYKVNLFDSEGEEYEGDTYSFETLPRPQVSNVRLQQVKGASTSTVLVTWNSNTPITSVVTYYPSASPGQALDDIDVKLVEAHRALISGLLPSTPYTLVVKGRDKAGNEAVSNPQSFTTATDTRPPVIANLKVEPVIEGVGEEAVARLVVSWDTDEPATAQVSYGEGSTGELSSSTQISDNLTFNHVSVVPNLQPARVYHLRAISIDEAGNEAQSIDSVVITPKATDSALNLVVNNLSQAFSFLKTINN